MPTTPSRHALMIGGWPANFCPAICCSQGPRALMPFSAISGGVGISLKAALTSGWIPQRLASGRALSRARSRGEVRICMGPMVSMSRARLTAASLPSSDRPGSGSSSNRAAALACRTRYSRAITPPLQQVYPHILPRHHRSRPELTRFGLQGLHEQVLMIGVMMEDRKSLRAGRAAKAHPFLPGGMAPAGADLELPICIGAVVDD